MQLRLIVEHALVREFKAVDAPDAPIGAPLAPLPMGATAKQQTHARTHAHTWMHARTQPHTAAHKRLRHAQPQALHTLYLR
jgi:hypothetical protein